VGDTMAVLIISLVAQWLIFLPVAYLVAVVLDGGLLALWGSMVLYRTLSVTAALIRFQQGAWAHKAV
jgi:Na+-driven multidrug efflux pump